MRNQQQQTATLYKKHAPLLPDHSSFSIAISAHCTKNVLANVKKMFTHSASKANRFPLSTC